MTRPPAPVEETFNILRENYVFKPPSMEPFKELIFTILSQRTRDENTEVATAQLLEKYPNVEQLARADPNIVEDLIRPAGFYRAKTRSVIRVSKILEKQYKGKVPEKMVALLSLPSVGRKTANCVLVYGFDKEAMPVDTHVHRISNRLGWAKTKHPDETELVLREVLPRAYWKEINSLLIDFGRRTCQPRKPKCQQCQIEHLCPSSLVMEDIK